MDYSGNPKISPEVQQRLRDTFGQTLELALRGSRQEALLGCDFLLRMDPTFEPARALLQRLRQAGEGPLAPGSLDDLRPHGGVAVATATAPADPNETSFADLRWPEIGEPEAVAALGPIATDETPDPAVVERLRRALSARDDAEALAIAQRHPLAVSSDPALLDAVARAQERAEAAPYVDKFLRAAQSSMDKGDNEGAQRHLDKVRALDPEHPLLAQLGDQAQTWRAAEPAVVEREATSAAAPESSVDGLTEEQWIRDPTGFSDLSDLGARSEPAAGERPPRAATAEDARIVELLAEGQAAFDGGDYQGSIDAWSRIFLIDIDHQGASDRIEEARRHKAESERRVEELFQEGVSRFEAGDREGAQTVFQRVLTLQPTYLAAREYLERPDEAAARPNTRRATGSTPLAGGRTGVGFSGGPGVSAGPGGAAAGKKGGLPLKQQILVPPEPGAEPSVPPTDRAGGGARPARGRGLLLGGGLLLVLVVGAGYWLFQKRDRFFPNRQSPEAVAPLASDPIQRAEQLHAAGKTSAAIAALRRIAAADPLHERAEALIAQWESLDPPPVPAGPAPEQIALQAQLVLEARQAFEEKRYAASVARLDEAAAIAPLPDTALSLARDARIIVESYASQTTLFRQGEWEAILPTLWRLHAKDPTNRDLIGLIVDSYFNLGIRDLQRESPNEARDKFREALDLRSDDAELTRLDRFAESYRQRPPDLQYRIFVKYLPFRSRT